VANARYKNRGELTSTRHGVDPAGTRRRLQALYALGWGWKDIGDRLSMTNQVIYRIASGKHATVMERTADKIAALYDQLSDVRPIGPTANWIRSSARRHKFLPPIAWDDDTMDDPAAMPSLLALDPDDLPIETRALMASQLVDLGYKIYPACKRAGIDPRYFKRQREEAA
jgi:hypothetical protein